MSEHTPVVHPSSFRDPSGFVFTSGDQVFRQVNLVYKDHYDHFMASGLYEALRNKKLLIPHTEAAIACPQPAIGYKVIQPEKIPFLSWPYEWCFEMLKDAALLTLQVALNALDHEMELKDATPYNIQWDGRKLVFIDTLSFEKYVPGKPWVAYRQFCECFLAPLLLMHYRKISLHQWQLAYPQGIPLAVASRMLPWKSRFSMLCYLHIHLHAKMAAGKKNEKEKTAHLPKAKLLKLLSSLELLVRSLRLDNKNTTWGNYYDEASLRNDYLQQKEKIISAWLDGFPASRTGIDFGANEGLFTELLSSRNIFMVAADGDPAAITNLYAKTKNGSITNCVPLIVNLAFPSPGIGLNNGERSPFMERARDHDIGLCLALIHHLHITHHVPFDRLATFLHGMCKILIIEFIPRTDEKVKAMLEGKTNSFETLNQGAFESAFSTQFTILEKLQVSGTERVLYLMERR